MNLVGENSLHGFVILKSHYRNLKNSNQFDEKIMLKKAHYFIAISIVIIITIAIIYSLAFTDVKTETTDLSENAIHLDELTLGGEKLNIKPIRAIRKPPFVELSEQDKQGIFTFISRVIKKIPVSDDNDLLHNNETKGLLTAIYDRFNHSEIETFDEATLREIKSIVLTQLDTKSAEDLIQLIDGYVAYRDAEKAITPLDPQGREILKFYEQKLQLRRVYLGLKVANALFMQEEAFSRYAIQVKFLKSDQTLPENEKQQLAAHLQSAFLAEFSKVMPQHALQKMEVKAGELKEEGANEVEMFQFYVSRVGAALGKNQLSFN